MSNFSAKIIMGLYPLLMLLQLSCQSTRRPHQEIKPSVYEDAFLLIFKSEYFDSKAISPEQVLVSKEIIKFENYSIYFRDELSSAVKFAPEYYLSDPWVIGTVPKSRSKVNNKKHLKHTIFFSEVKNSYFFAEVFINPSNPRMSYFKRPMFGESDVFLFAIEEGHVKLIKTQKFFYN